MNEADLRALVRDAVRRHLGTSEASPSAPRPPHPPAPDAAAWRHHASHQLHITLVNADDSCVIEPSVACDHCGYCKSHGH